MDKDALDVLFEKIDTDRDNHIKQLTKLFTDSGLLVDKPTEVWQFEQKERYNKEVLLISGIAYRNKIRIKEQIGA